MREINKIKLYLNGDNKSLQVKDILEKELIKHHFELVNDNYDLAISIGGDGTFLKMVNENHFNNKIYYIGINSGTLGFLQEIDIDKTIDFVKRLNDNNYKVEKLSIGSCKVITKRSKTQYNFLNEIVIRKKNFSTLEVPLYIDDELLEEFVGDGLLISTSTGSTAYNMSFGGAIIYNSLKTLSLTPIAPINNRAYRTLTNSFILPVDKKIKLTPNNDIFIMVDGKNKEMDDVKEINVTIDNKSIKCLRMNEFHFVKVVKNKILK